MLSFSFVLLLSSFSAVNPFSQRQYHSTRLQGYCATTTIFRSDKKYDAANIPFLSLQTPLHLFGSNRQGTGIALTEVTEIDGRTPTSTESNSTEVLRFGGENNYTSKALVMPSDVGIIHDFFSKPQHQKVLLTSGRRDDGSEMEELDIGTIDLQKWIDNALIMGADAPVVEEDKVIKVTPQGIGILTVKVCPLTVIGTKVTSVQTHPHLQQPMPEYQAVLIQDYPRAEGPRPLVWLFNKIVYGGDPESEKNNSKTRRQDEKAMLRLWTERLPTDGDNNEMFVFKAEAKLFLEFEFPRLLLRFFPLSKEKAEVLCR